MPDYSNPYEILGLRPGASLQEVKAQYRRLSLKHHPDLCEAHLRPAAEKYFKDITAAYTALTKQRSGTTLNSHHPYAATERYTYGMSRATAVSPGKYSNGVVAAIIAVPLVLLGMWLQHKSNSPAYSDEMAYRPNGFLSPPVNPYLRDDLQPRTLSRFWGRSFGHIADGQAGVKSIIDSSKNEN